MKTPYTHARNGQCTSVQVAACLRAPALRAAHEALLYEVASNGRRQTVERRRGARPHLGDDERTLGGAQARVYSRGGVERVSPTWHDTQRIIIVTNRSKRNAVSNDAHPIFFSNRYFKSNIFMIV